MQNASLAEGEPPTAAVRSLADLGGLFRQKAYIAGQWRDGEASTVDRHHAKIDRKALTTLL